MKKPRILLFLCVLLGVLRLDADVPQLLHYQGRVAVNNVNFTGLGQFKFALVSADGSTSYWSHDGTSVNGGEPTGLLKLDVTHGLYSVLLGDATLPGMDALPSSVFQNNDVHLRVWFNDGSTGFQQLTPDQRIAAVGYAMVAATAQTVADGAVTADSIAAGVITSDKLENGAVTNDKIAPLSIDGSKIAEGAVAARLQADGFSGVPSGAGVLSNEIDPDLNAAGFEFSEEVVSSARWRALPNENGGASRYGHTATPISQDEVVIIGGATAPGSYPITGYRYKASLDSWVEVGPWNGFSGRQDHVAVWTGSEVLVWGGIIGGESLATGIHWNPGTNDTQLISHTQAPEARSSAVAVWTGTEMIVWGGLGEAGALNTGGRYNPATRTWTPMTIVDAPVARYGHQGVWTGSEFIVYGGRDGGIYHGDGAKYNPQTNSWSPLPNLNAPIGRVGHSMVWDGSKVIVWGGTNGGLGLQGGGIYNPAGNTWTLLNPGQANEPLGRYHHRAVWLDGNMYVWGGYQDEGTRLNSGAYFDPQTQVWTPMPSANAPSPRGDHTFLPLNGDLWVWGGFTTSQEWSTYDPDAASWETVKRVNLSDKIVYPVWAEGHLFVFGGYNQDVGVAVATDLFAKYNPQTDSWISLDSPANPSGRISPAIGSDGRNIVVVGGVEGNASVPDYNLVSQRYDTQTSSWVSLPEQNAPSPRTDAHFLFTGSEFILMGGNDENFFDLSDGAVLDPSTWTWSAMAPPPFNNSRIRAIEWSGSRVLVLVTDLNNDASTPSLYQYDPATNTWDPTGSEPPDARTGFASFDSVWLASGRVVFQGPGLWAVMKSGDIFERDYWSYLYEPGVGWSQQNKGYDWSLSPVESAFEASNQFWKHRGTLYMFSSDSLYRVTKADSPTRDSISGHLPWITGRQTFDPSGRIYMQSQREDGEFAIFTFIPPTSRYLYLRP